MELASLTGSLFCALNCVSGIELCWSALGMHVSAVFFIWSHSAVTGLFLLVYFRVFLSHELLSVLLLPFVCNYGYWTPLVMGAENGGRGDASPQSRNQRGRPPQKF